MPNSKGERCERCGGALGETPRTHVDRDGVLFATCGCEGGAPCGNPACPCNNPDNAVPPANVAPADSGSRPIRLADFLVMLHDMRAKHYALGLAITHLETAINSGAITDPPERADDTASPDIFEEPK